MPRSKTYAGSDDFSSAPAPARSQTPRTRTPTRAFQLRRQLQPPQRVVPHPLEHCGDGAERVAARAVEALLLVGARVDQPRARERAELQRHGAEGDIRHRAMDGAGAIHRAMPDV